jgi:putative ubiquitin-RnfH superfamily antitoxin RatB of RatAB toxin-antitoxin module
MAKYEKEGFLVMPEIYSASVVQAMKQRMAEIVEDVDIKDNNIAVFSTEDNNKQRREDYFLDSAW